MGGRALGREVPRRRSWCRAHFLPGGSGGWWRVLLALAGLCLAGVCCSTSTGSLACRCACVRCQRPEVAGGRWAEPSPLQAGHCGRTSCVLLQSLCYSSRFFFPLPANVSRRPPAAAWKPAPDPLDTCGYFRVYISHIPCDLCTVLFRDYGNVCPTSTRSEVKSCCQGEGSLPDTPVDDFMPQIASCSAFLSILLSPEVFCIKFHGT